MKLREAWEFVRNGASVMPRISPEYDLEAHIRVYDHCCAVLDAAVEAHEARTTYTNETSRQPSDRARGLAAYQAKCASDNKLRALESVTREEAGSHV